VRVLVIVGFVALLAAPASLGSTDGHERAHSAQPAVAAPAGAPVPEKSPAPRAAGVGLTPQAAEELLLVAVGAGLDWDVLLAVARAGGRDAVGEAAGARLRPLARALARLGAGEHPWRAAERLLGADAGRARAIARSYRAQGLEALVVWGDSSAP
jgi:hypothetical protein